MRPKNHQRYRPPGRQASAHAAAVSGSSSAAGAVSNTHTNGFTMQDEARNTSSRPSVSALGSETKLRLNPVVFVSGGLIEPLKPLPVSTEPATGKDTDVREASPANVGHHSPALAKGEGKKGKKAEAPAAQAPAPTQASPALAENIIPPQPQSPQPQFFFDLSGDKTMKMPTLSSAPVVPNTETGHETDSSEEVILYKGRSRAPAPAPAPALAESRSDSDVKTEPLSVIKVEERVAVATGADGTFMEHSVRIVEEKHQQIDDDAGSKGDGDGDDDTGSKGDDDTGSKGGDGNDGDDDDDDDDGDQRNDEEAILNDYIANMKAEDNDVKSFNANRELGADDGAINHGNSTAGAVEDTFENLNIQDWTDYESAWGYPSGRTGHWRVSSNQPPDFPGVDPETRAKLGDQWKKDRLRKKEHKKEREEKRTQGDLLNKYPAGLSLDNIKAELTTFLLGSAETMMFPPMDPHARRLVHDLALKLQIKSKSHGQGKERQPSVNRTRNTPRLAADVVIRRVDMAAAKVARKFFGRPGVKGGGGRGPGGGSSGGAGGGGGSGGWSGGNMAAMNLRDGEIVGASAPELGQENKGRAMLEKMGWSKGMALGAFENQGILEPVAQVVKRSKAGLG